MLLLHPLVVGFLYAFLRPFFTRSRPANAPLLSVCLLHFDLGIILRIVVRFTLELFFALTRSFHFVIWLSGMANLVCRRT